MSIVAPTKVVVKRANGKGKGVFASCRIPKSVVIERSPTVAIPEAELGDVLGSYVYENDQRTSVIGLGFLSLYNHSRRPNAAAYHAGPRTMEIVALRDIKENEEVTINYGSAYRDREWY